MAQVVKAPGLFRRPLRLVGAVGGQARSSQKQSQLFANGPKRSVALAWTPPTSCISDLDGCSADAANLMPDTPHWRTAARNNIGEVDVRLPHAVYTREELDNVEIIHTRPHGIIDRAAYATVWTLRRAFDLFTGYTMGRRDEHCMIRRVVVLETVAGVPGMVGAAIRHLRSLRKLSKDYGFIHTLLEEAENERMHLMTALLLDNPSSMVRATVIVAQALFLAWYTIMYALCPRYCHRFVGYLEEEAVKTYTTIVQYIDQNKLAAFKALAPAAVRTYWRLPEDATLRDVFLSIRADEAHHREVNHTFADLVPIPAAVNPFPPGY